MTAHNKAKKGEIAKIVLMPGDPLRAKWMAETFLSSYKMVNDVRGMYAFTGKYNDKEVTIMGHGMGIASIGIYSYELFNAYDVDVIIRVGSAGSYTEDINVGDLILAKDSYSESTYAELIGVEAKNKLINASQDINEIILETAKENNLNISYSTVHSSDVFYGGVKPFKEIEKETNSKVVEMESFGLFANAIKLNKKAATLLTCSDSLVTHEAMSAEDRQTKFKNMVLLALKSAEKM